MLIEIDNQVLMSKTSQSSRTWTILSPYMFYVLSRIAMMSFIRTITVHPKDGSLKVNNQMPNPPKPMTWLFKNVGIIPSPFNLLVY